jgi:hypothetical protein
VNGDQKEKREERGEKLTGWMCGSGGGAAPGASPKPREPVQLGDGVHMFCSALGTRPRPGTFLLQEGLPVDLQTPAQLLGIQARLLDYRKRGWGSCGLRQRVLTQN